VNRQSHITGNPKNIRAISIACQIVAAPRFHPPAYKRDDAAAFLKDAVMDWALAIEKNREAPKSVLAMLVAMVAAVNGGGAGGQFPFLPQKGSDASGQRQPEKSKLSPALPRHLHRSVLRLLRPAEAAARRLIFVAARGLVVKVGPPRRRKPNAKPLLNRKNGFGTNVVIRPGPLPEWARALAPKRSSTVSLPLFDPLKRFGVRRRYVKQGNIPRISLLGDRPFNPLFARPHLPDPVPQPPSPDDPLDASRLHRRLEAIGRALDDLPGQAKRFARWQARRDARVAQRRDHDTADSQGGGEVDRGGNGSRRLQRLSPMRPGRPPGWRRKPDHGVYEVLNDIHGLAVCVRDAADTS
jgi:hypothetical protein